MLFNSRLTIYIVDILSKEIDIYRFKTIPVAIIIDLLCILSIYLVKRLYVYYHCSRLTISIEFITISFYYQFASYTNNLYILFISRL